MRSSIRHYFGRQSLLLYLVAVFISCCIGLIGNNSFTYLEPLIADQGAVIQEGEVYLFSPLQCAVFLIPVFLISFYMIERKICAIEMIVEPRLDPVSYKTKNIIIHLINCLLYSLFTAIAITLSNIWSGVSVPAIVAVESFITKMMYLMVISLILEILRIFKMKMILACFTVYILILAEYLLTYSYRLFAGVLFPYATFKINQAGSYIYLAGWLVGVLIIYIISRMRLQEFYDEKQE